MPAQAGNLYLEGGSAIFASCTVSNYREALKGHAIEPGSVMVQRCFRTRTLEDLHGSSRLSRNALFDMYGGFETSDADKMGERLDVHSRIAQLVLEECGVNKSRLAFMGSKADLEKWGLDIGDSSISYHAYAQGQPASYSTGTSR